MNKKTEHIKDVLSRVEHKFLDKSDFLSTGSTVLNLALTNKPDRGFIKGTYNLFVGDTDSGKTFICLTCLAEASINPSFDEYRYILINKERGTLMNIEKFFGPKVAEKLEMVYLENLEDMYFYLDDVMKEDKKKKIIPKPFICIVDSIDSLSSEYENKKFEERKKASRGGPKAKGDYGDGKAAIHSRNIRRILSGLERTKSILIFINQTRININAGKFEPPKTHSGGEAISFYAAAKLWSAKAGQTTKIYKEKKRQTGIIAKIKIHRTRVTGRANVVSVPIYHSVGMDDVGSCVDYLVNEKHWKKNDSGMITANDFDISERREKLIKYIEDNDLEFDLRQLVADVWREIEKAVAVVRKKKYI